MSDPFKTDDIFKGAKVDDFKKENASLKSRIKELESELKAEREELYENHCFNKESEDDVKWR